MKKFYVLALGLFTISFVFAQSPSERQQGFPNNDRRNDAYAHSNNSVYNNPGNTYGYPPTNNRGGVYSRDYNRSNSSNTTFDRRINEQYSFLLRERDARIHSINREYENRIGYITYNRFMTNATKRWELRKLESQRQQEIKMVLARFDDRRSTLNNRYHDRKYNWRN